MSSSGGNAGYAVAWAGRTLGVPVTVVVPTTTGEHMRRLIEETGATVRIAGEVWDDAHTEAKKIAALTHGALLHPFDHPDIWEGHATLMTEIADAGLVPGCVIVSVGGGGLLCGVCEGMEKLGWGDRPILAVETEGAASFAAADKADHPVTLDAITSLAKTRSRRVCDQLLVRSKQHDIRSIVVSDQAAVNACARSADDHRILVEPSCGAALSVVYD